MTKPLIKLACGCRVAATPYNSHELIFCPLHNSAPDLLATLNTVLATAACAASCQREIKQAREFAKRFSEPTTKAFEQVPGYAVHPADEMGKPTVWVLTKNSGQIIVGTFKTKQEANRAIPMRENETPQKTDAFLESQRPESRQAAVVGLAEDSTRQHPARGKAGEFPVA